MRIRRSATVIVCLAAIAAPAAVRALEPPSAPPVPAEIPRDPGAGELLRVVVGGVYATRAEAAAAGERLAFGDLQGYYVVPVAQFGGLREQVGGAGEFALVSAFRTEAGALAFVDLARGFGVPADLLPAAVRSLGGVYAGLGQEAAPDGSGPLLRPLP